MQAEPERRMEIYQRLRAIALQLDGRSAESMVPFMLLDTDIGIVSSATSDYASFATLIDNDPMRPREIVGMIAARARHAFPGGHWRIARARRSTVLRTGPAAMRYPR